MESFNEMIPLERRGLLDGISWQRNGFSNKPDWSKLLFWLSSENLLLIFDNMSSVI